MLLPVRHTLSQFVTFRTSKGVRDQQRCPFARLSGTDFMGEIIEIIRAQINELI